jgi:hypothetical protein
LETNGKYQRTYVQKVLAKWNMQIVDFVELKKYLSREISLSHVVNFGICMYISFYQKWMVRY